MHNNSDEGKEKKLNYTSICIVSEIYTQDDLEYKSLYNCMSLYQRSIIQIQKRKKKENQNRNLLYIISWSLKRL